MLTQQIRKKHKRMGAKKLHEKLAPKFAELGIKCGRDNYIDILREEGLLVKYRKRYVKTTQSKHMFFTYGNLIKDLKVTGAEQVFVSDITYIRTKNGFLYLYLITDLYSKQIMGWALSDNLKTINAIAALQMALKKRIYPNRKLIHHSDRGFQYCNPEYIKVLEGNKVAISMTTKYDPYENAVAERVNGILKNEYEIEGCFLSETDARREINHTIWLYNNDRPHLSCKMLTPAQAHVCGNYKLKYWGRKKELR
jgi:putative transposase